MNPAAIPDPSDRRTWIVNDGHQVIKGVHLRSECAGEHCTLHNPSDHHMREWTLFWRDDRRIMERICPHGVGHPDPDGINPDTVHGCDGCCRPPKENDGDQSE